MTYPLRSVNEDIILLFNRQPYNVHAQHSIVVYSRRHHRQPHRSTSVVIAIDFPPSPQLQNINGCLAETALEECCVIVINEILDYLPFA